MNKVRFTVTPRQNFLIRKIVDRYLRKNPSEDSIDRQHFEMNLCACHAQGCRLDFDWLLEHASDFDLNHDMTGIDRFLSRETGEMTGCFLPRAARNPRGLKRYSKPAVQGGAEHDPV